MASHDSFVKII